MSTDGATEQVAKRQEEEAMPEWGAYLTYAQAKRYAGISEETVCDA